MGGNVKAQFAARGIQTGALLSLLEERHAHLRQAGPASARLCSGADSSAGQRASLASRARFLSELLEHSPGLDGPGARSGLQLLLRGEGELRLHARRWDGCSRRWPAARDSARRAAPGPTLMRGCRTGRGRIAGGAAQVRGMGAQDRDPAPARVRPGHPGAPARPDDRHRRVHPALLACRGCGAAVRAPGPAHLGRREHSAPTGMRRRLTKEAGAPPRSLPPWAAAAQGAAARTPTPLPGGSRHGSTPRGPRRSAG